MAVHWCGYVEEAWLILIYLWQPHDDYLLHQLSHGNHASILGLTHVPMDTIPDLLEVRLGLHVHNECLSQLNDQ